MTASSPRGTFSQAELTAEPVLTRSITRRAEATFDPLPYDQGAARLYGQICAAVHAAGRQPRRRTSDLMIAATAASNQLPLYTANPDDFKGVEGFVEVVGIQARPNSL
jgi:predicted nucleic acid-binding protein